MTDRPIQEKYQ